MSREGSDGWPQGRRSKWKAGVAACALLLAACGGGDGGASPTDEAGGTGGISCDSTQGLKFAFITPEDTPYDAGGDVFGQYLEDNAPGCFDFQSFSSGQLGEEQDIEQAIQAGAIQLGVGAFALASFVDEAPLFMTPFVFSGRKHTYAVADGPIGDEFAQRVEEKASFKVLGYFTAGDRHILSTKPVRSEDDLQGLKLRVAPSDLQVNIWRAIGVNPVDLPLGDMYTGLQTGTVDAVEFDPALIVALKLYEVTKYYTLTDHLTGAYPLIMDVNFYNSLSADLQKVIDEAGAAAEDANRAKDEELNDVSLEKLENELGIEVIPFENAELRQQVQSVYEEFPEALPPDVLEEILAADPNE